MLVRKLPPDWPHRWLSFMVKVTGGTPATCTRRCKSTIESLIIGNDPRLRSVSPTDKPDALITCQVTSYSLQPANETQAGVTFGKNPRRRRHSSTSRT